MKIFLVLYGHENPTIELSFTFDDTVTIPQFDCRLMGGAIAMSEDTAKELIEAEWPTETQGFSKTHVLAYDIEKFDQLFATSGPDNEVTPITDITFDEPYAFCLMSDRDFLETWQHR